MVEVIKIDNIFEEVCIAGGEISKMTKIWIKEHNKLSTEN